MQGGWGPKHLGDSGRHRLAKQIAADIEECPEEIITRAFKWFDTAAKLTQAKPPRELPLARLVRDGNDHIRRIEALLGATNAGKYEKRIRKWKALVAGWENHRHVAADAEVLPTAFTAAAAWFRTAKRLTITDAKTLGNLASVGNQLINAVEAVEIASYPRGSRLTSACLIMKWKHLVLCWDVALIEANVQVLRAGRRRRNLREAQFAQKQLEISKKYVDETSRNLANLKVQWSVHRAKQRKKRTCSHCGATAPLSARAFPYCGGCRHSPRVDRPRYCSEECQRAHWLAGHMNECPSCTG